MARLHQPLPRSRSLKARAADLARFAQSVFQHHGVAPDDARICARVLLSADLRGVDTHGISRLKYYSDRLASGITRPTTSLRRVRDTGTTAVLDAGLGIGHAAAARAMNLAIAKAARRGIGAVAVRNATHFGIAGYFALMAAKRGMIGIAATNARPAVAPTFSVQPLFGTNPLAFAAPSDEPFDFCFDAALSTIQRGNVEVAERLGRKLSAGVAVDAKGRDIRDPSQLLRALTSLTGALLPLGGAGETLGGHKGYGLAIMVEILCAALQDGDFLSGLAGGVEGGKARPYRLGHFFMALDVKSFTPLPRFRRTVGGIMRELRGAKKVPRCRRVWAPGEKEWETHQRRARLGIPISPELQSELRTLARELDLKPPF